MARLRARESLRLPTRSSLLPSECERCFSFGSFLSSDVPPQKRGLERLHILFEIEHCLTAATSEIHSVAPLSVLVQNLDRAFWQRGHLDRQGVEWIARNIDYRQHANPAHGA